MRLWDSVSFCFTDGTSTASAPSPSSEEAAEVCKWRYETTYSSENLCKLLENHLDFVCLGGKWNSEQIHPILFKHVCFQCKYPICSILFHIYLFRICISICSSNSNYSWNRMIGKIMFKEDVCLKQQKEAVYSYLSGMGSFENHLPERTPLSRQNKRNVWKASLKINLWQEHHSSFSGQLLWKCCWPKYL